MEKELVQLFEEVKRAGDAAAADVGADSTPEEELCLEALQKLKGFPINYDVLVSTQIGKRLRQLTKHPRKKIQSLASDVVAMWKDIILKETASKQQNGSTGNGKSASGDHSGEKNYQRVNSIKSVDSAKPEPDSAETEDKKKAQKLSAVKAERSNSVRREPASAEHEDKKSAVKVEKSSSVKRESDSAEYEDKKKVQKLSAVKVERKDGSHSATNVKVETSSTSVKVENGNAFKSEKIESVIKEERSFSDMKKPSAQSPIGIPKLSSLPLTKDKNRDKFRELLAEGLSKVPGEVWDSLKAEVHKCDPFRVAAEVESALYSKWGLFNGPQKVKYRSIMFNIKDPKNPDFRRKVLLGEYPPEVFTQLTPEQMASDERQSENEKIKEKALFECERGIKPKASTDQFKCSRCHKRETTYYQLQTRSADEPMTTYVTCVNCGKNWKFC